MIEKTFEFQNIWKNVSSDLEEKIIDFWTSKGSIDEDVAKQRASQAAFIVCCEEAIIAVCTVFETYSQRLRNTFFAYRIIVDEQYRQQKIAFKLIHIANNYFEQLFLMGETKNVGSLIMSENKKVNAYHNEAIWPTTKFVFIGYGPKGEHIRVKYFENARITDE